MSDHLARQLVLLRQLIREYREGELSLNLLVQRVEGVGAAIDSESWTDSTFYFQWNRSMRSRLIPKDI
ncbi:hypothetical protein HX882_23120 [Pseudomonas gingeri]|uniref:Uncharacterized protein n=1 Tax=Pseudomonas gingeri TaxID=117681 RepID=A0A7Y7XHB6_9PSED|nr:hypothetical protein [Pseudomonas gingeri]NWB98787.1 hypothetical protein [Pseudomonas gingeri]